MKKILSIILAILSAFSLFSFSACKENNEPKVQTVSLEYYQSAGDMLPLLKQSVLEVGLLPEPAATKLETIAPEKTWHRLDLQELYDKDAKSYPQAVMMVKSSLLAAYPELVSNVKTQFSGSIDWVKQNLNSAINAINSKLSQGLTPSLNANNLNAQVIDNCKVYWTDAVDSKDSVKAYLDDILDIGLSLSIPPAKKVNDDFFYDGSVQTSAGSFDTIKVVAPDGAPAIALAKFINDNQNFSTEKTFDYSIVDSSKIGSFMQTGSADIIIMPVNASSKLYNVNPQDPYKLVSVVTHGNLYIVSSKEISISSLDGVKMGVIGQGLVPDLTLKSVLKKNSINVK